ncbi:MULTISPECIES: hypothetical protein [Pseudomonas]|uniref:Uncharacterized protein n=1 Tax=Pseudomonas glycinae TaxID=1785145 RepID=A0ABN4MN82_9PSED|nr:MULTISPECIES: hypothetical protein [Pseudomonas]AMQ82526.1 hypothetical protein AWU82_04275 [Pseudomonas glycinae]
MFDEQLSISRIEVKFDAGRSGQHKTLYANGRMQVRVLVLLHGVDNSGDDASLYGHPALQSLRLIAYNGARPLEGDWSVSTQENRYAHEMSGGAPRMTEVPRVKNNRISDDSDPVQVFEFWVSASRPGIMEVAAEIVMNNVTLRTNGIGFDSSVTLEAVPPKVYPLSSFSLRKYDDAQQRAGYDWIQLYHIGLQAEGRQVHLLDWYSSEVKLDPYDSEEAVQVYVSGNISGTQDGRRNFYGYMAPIYGEKATFRGPLGYVTVPINKVPGQLTLVQYVSADLQVARESESAFEFAVIDEFGTEHRLSLDGNKEQRNFILDESRRSMKQLA